MNDNYCDNCGDGLKDKNKEIADLNKKLKKAVELLDGCNEIVEIFSDKYPAQKEWKKRWLADTKTLIDEYLKG